MNAILASALPQVLPTVLELTGIALGGVLLRASLVAKKRWGIDIEARHREALHSALMSGVRAALAKGLSGQAAIQAAVDHATSSVPDAMRGLNPTMEVLGNIAAAKLREAVA